MRPRQVGLEEANDLVDTWLISSICRGRSCTLDDYRVKDSPDFYFFAALWNNPSGSPLIAYYAVYARTGDVCSAIICKRITSPALARFQKTIRQRIGLSEIDYRKVRTPGPMSLGSWEMLRSLRISFRGHFSIDLRECDSDSSPRASASCDQRSVASSGLRLSSSGGVRCDLPSISAKLHTAPAAGTLLARIVEVQDACPALPNS